MKNRKLFVISFLVVATLLMTVGFATLSGNLIVNGRATFTGKTLTQTGVTQQLKFADVETENCKAELVADGTTGAVQNARMTVDFHDTTGEGTDFVASAVFTIQYGEKTSALPDLTLGPINDESVLITEGAETKGQFTVTCEWVEKNGDAWSGTGSIASQDLVAGDMRYMRVTVRYEKPQNANVDNISCDAVLAIKMPWVTAAEG